MLPQQREMVKKLEGKPFVLLGINSDSGRSGLKARFEKESVTWPNILEGSHGEKDGAKISKKWNIHGYPTIFIIDPAGKIVKRGFLSHELIEQAVEAQLAAAKP